MKKTLTILNYIGDAFILISFIWCMIATGNSRVSQYLPSRYCIGIGLLLVIPLAFYKMWHWDEYEKENRQALIFVTSIIVLFLIAFTIFGI